MPYWNGTIYAPSAALTANGNSGFFALPIIGALGGGVKRAILKLVPADLATDETLDLDLNIAWDADGNGDVKVHDFTQVDSNNTEELLFLPGGDSAGLLFKELGTNAGVLGSLIPPYWKLAWTLAGTTKSMTFTLYGCLEF